MTTARRRPRWGWPVCLALMAVIAAPLAASVRDDVGFDQHIGERLPLEAEFRDEEGAAVTLGGCLHDRPAVVVFGYFDCPQLCGITADAVLDALRELRPSVGRDFDLIYVSIDPADTALAAHAERRRQVRLYGREQDGSGWHFLTGSKEAIDRATDAAGFRYQAVPGLRQFAHASGFLVARPDGVISRYFLGIDFRPAEVATALEDAAAGRNGPTVFDLVLLCFTGDTASGITRWVMRALQAGALVCVGGLGFGIVRMVRAERRRLPEVQEGET